MKFLTLISLQIFILTAVNLHAHAGHDKAPGDDGESGNGSRIRVSSETIQNLNLETTKAEIKLTHKTITLPGMAELPSNKEVRISSRIEGRITEILTKAGENVVEGAGLFKIESLTFGNTTITIRAPIGGTVTFVHGVVGQSISPETVLASVVNLSQMVIRGTSYENESILKVENGNSATATSAIYPGKVFQGTVSWIEAGFDKPSQTLQVGVSVDNFDKKIRSGMQLVLHIDIGKPDDTLVIPKRAVLGELGNYFVLVQDAEDKNEFEKRNVVLGDLFGDQIEIQEGVFPGDAVVVQGNYQLQFAPASTVKKGESKEISISNSLFKNKWLYGIFTLTLLIISVMFWLLKRKNHV